MDRRVVRIQRPSQLEPSEAARVRELRTQVAKELPEIKRRAKRLLGDSRAVSVVFNALKAARQEQGLSLGDVERMTGIDRSALSELERGERPNVTIETLERYAAALGKRLRLELDDVDASPREGGSR